MREAKLMLSRTRSFWYYQWDVPSRDERRARINYAAMLRTLKYK